MNIFIICLVLVIFSCARGQAPTCTPFSESPIYQGNTCDDDDEPPSFGYDYQDELDYLNAECPCPRTIEQLMAGPQGQCEWVGHYVKCASATHMERFEFERKFSGPSKKRQRANLLLRDRHPASLLIDAVDSAETIAAVHRADAPDDEEHVRRAKRTIRATMASGSSSPALGRRELGTNTCTCECGCFFNMVQEAVVLDRSGRVCGACLGPSKRNVRGRDSDDDDSDDSDDDDDNDDDDDDDNDDSVDSSDSDSDEQTDSDDSDAQSIDDPFNGLLEAPLCGCCCDTIPADEVPRNPAAAAAFVQRLTEAEAAGLTAQLIGLSNDQVSNIAGTVDRVQLAELLVNLPRDELAATVALVDQDLDGFVLPQLGLLAMSTEEEFVEVLNLIKGDSKSQEDAAKVLADPGSQVLIATALDTNMLAGDGQAEALLGALGQNLALNIGERGAGAGKKRASAGRAGEMDVDPFARGELAKPPAWPTRRAKRADVHDDLILQDISGMFYGKDCVYEDNLGDFRQFLVDHVATDLDDVPNCDDCVYSDFDLDEVFSECVGALPAPACTVGQQRLGNTFVVNTPERDCGRPCIGRFEFQDCVHPTCAPLGCPVPGDTRPPPNFPTGAPTSAPTAGLIPSSAPTGAPTSAPTGAPTSTPTLAPTGVPTVPGATGAPSSAPTQAPTGTPTSAPSGAPTSAPSGAPTSAPSGAPTSAPTLAPTGAPTSAPSGAPTSAPSGAPTSAPTSVPTGVPTVPGATGAPTSAPTQTPTGAPTVAPSGAPTSAPTSAPSGAPSSAPTQAPTGAPTSAPSGAPTSAPTSAPTAAPTGAPTVPGATGAPTSAPTQAPSGAPTSTPTTEPTGAPTSVPTAAPTTAPTVAPTSVPTKAPTAAPTSAPTAAPTSAPTTAPTGAPTGAPTSAPTTAPTSAPTSSPTAAPTSAPTTAPTSSPTSSPTAVPTSAPTTAPTSSPTSAPTVTPTSAPTTAPTSAPTAAPTSAPTEAPTDAPTVAPTVAITVAPTAAPTTAPTAAPTAAAITIDIMEVQFMACGGLCGVFGSGGGFTSTGEFDGTELESPLPLGSEVDVLVDETASPGGSGPFIDCNLNDPDYVITSNAGDSGFGGVQVGPMLVVFTYDGADASPTLAATGLTADFSGHDRFELDISAYTAPPSGTNTAQIAVHTDGTDSSISPAVTISGAGTLTFNLADFTVNGGAGADFSSVGAVQLSVDMVNLSDGGASASLTLTEFRIV